MIPVIVGAAVVGAGAVLLSGDEPEHTEPEHTRQRVSESTVQRAMARSGRKIHTVSEAPHDAENFERVRKIIAEQLGVRVNEVQPYSRFIEDLGADSLDIVELIMAVEEEFNIEITDNSAEQMRTVSDAVRFISRGGS